MGGHSNRWNILSRKLQLLELWVWLKSSGTKSVWRKLDCLGKVGVSSFYKNFKALVVGSRLKTLFCT